MTNKYIMYIQNFLSVEIIHWNLKPGVRDIIIYPKRMKGIAVSIYIPFSYKNKQINLINFK
jgi:hypothetical protein